MGSEAAAWRAAGALTARSVLIGILALLCTHLLLTTHLYATAICIAGLIGVLSWSVAQRIAGIRRESEGELRALIEAAGMSCDLRAQEQGSTLHSATQMLELARARWQREIEHLQTLLDTVAAALIVVADDGKVQLANRAARALATRPVEHLGQIAALGQSAAHQLLALQSGAREVISTQSARNFFVAVAQFASPSEAPQRLISLQRVADLDAIELKAWIDMARILAHEIMNSLTPVASLSESLETLVVASTSDRGDRTAEILSALAMIKRRSQSLIDFVDRYRRVTELPQPRLEIVGVQDLVDGILRLLAPQMTAVHTRVCPDHLTVRADRQLLEQALINLVQNALAATTGVPNGRITITCSRSADHVELAVSDNGSGIPDEIREQVFLPFFTTKATGSGIGLTLTRQIAIAHRGRLEARRNEPRGSVFVLSLPCE
jgi:two-component system, NtrC family, nitrogen regulation sensor histidine kinase NtrY